LKTRFGVDVSCWPETEKKSEIVYLEAGLKCRTK